MATLAQDLLAKGIQLEDPFEKNKETLLKVGEQTLLQRGEKTAQDQDQDQEQREEIPKAVDADPPEPLKSRATERIQCESC